MPRVQVGDVWLAYDRAGAGAPIVFVHAYPLNRAIWEPQVAAFAPTRCVIAVDLRGFGESEAPNDSAAYGQERSVSDLIGLLDVLGIEKATFCGLSMGGNLALHVGLNHPDRVSALAIVDTGAGSEDPGAFAATVTSWAEAAEQRGIAGFSETIMANPIFAAYAERGPKERWFMQERIRANTAHGVAFTARKVLARRLPVYKLTARLREMNTPTLVIVGAEDTACLAPSRHLADTIPGARLATIPAAGHFNNLEAPAQFNKVLGEFLAGIPS